MFERGLESEPVGGEILLGGGGGGVNEFQVIIGVHRLSSCTTGSIPGNPFRYTAFICDERSETECFTPG